MAIISPASGVWPLLFDDLSLVIFRQPTNVCFKMKQKDNNTKPRHKARLVVKGFDQKKELILRTYFHQSSSVINSNGTHDSSQFGFGDRFKHDDRDIAKGESRNMSVIGRHVYRLMSHR